MASKIYSITPRADYIIDVKFFDGKVKRIDFSEKSDYKFTEDEFKKVSIDKSKTHLNWENGTQIDNSQLWYDGLLVEVSYIEDANIRFAERMRLMRESVWMTQKDLERKTGIHQADISKFERGEANPSISTMEKIANGMGYNLQFFAESSNKYEGDSVLDVLEYEGDNYIELIDGVIYDMAAPTYIHQAIISLFHLEFGLYIRKNGGDCEVVEAPTGVMFEDDTKDYFLPDLLVVCDPSKIKKHGVVGAPDFVLEVISESTSIRDYHFKLAKYSQYGVREYWIIDPYKKVLVKYDLQNEAMPEIHFFDEEVEVSIYGGELKIDLREINKIVERNYD